MIQLTNVNKKYGTNVVLNNINYRFRDTGISCILGASGCGKTTLLNLLAGFDTDYSGSISIGNEIITGLEPDELSRYRRNNVGFIFQNYHLVKGYTVLENILLAAELNGSSEADNIKSALKLLTNLGISSKANNLVEHLSGGEKQRVAIARALINDPKIIFADEPTGALDRSTSTQIMELLKEISKDKLIVLITHDKKICDFADDVISIVDGSIKVETSSPLHEEKIINNKSLSNNGKVSAFSRAYKNYKVHLLRYIAISLTIAIGICSFILSMSSGNLIDQSIEEFKQKNTAFNNGYVKNDTLDSVFSLLETDERIDDLYYQYILNDIILLYEDKSIEMSEKVPMPKATESMSYGIMPRKDHSEIAITPSLAKKLAANIQELIGQTLSLSIDSNKMELTISGIYNAGYDDFFVSSDLEKEMYKNINQSEPFSLSYDVKDFDDIVTVNNMLKSNDITAKTAAEQAASLQDTFSKLSKLFLVLSVLVLGIGLFICIILLTKLTNARLREIGLLSALGYQKKWIHSMLKLEHLLLSCTSTVLNLVILFAVAYVGGEFFDLPLIIKPLQVLLSIVLTFSVNFSVSMLTGRKLINTEPAKALA